MMGYSIPYSGIVYYSQPTRKRRSFFDLCQETLQLAADLCAEGDASRVEIKTNEETHELELFLDGKLTKDLERAQ